MQRSLPPPPHLRTGAFGPARVVESTPQRKAANRITPWQLVDLSLKAGVRKVSRARA